MKDLVLLSGGKVCQGALWRGSRMRWGNQAVLGRVWQAVAELGCLDPHSHQSLTSCVI